MSKQAKTYLSAFGALQIIVATVLLVSFIPREAIPHLFNIHEKGELVHFIMYGSLSSVVVAVLWQLSVKRWALVTFIACTSMGVAIEFLQPVLTRNRSFDVYDMLFNTIGVCIGLTGAYVYKNRTMIAQQFAFLFGRKSIGA